MNSDEMSTPPESNPIVADSTRDEHSETDAPTVPLAMPVAAPVEGADAPPRRIVRSIFVPWLLMHRPADCGASMAASPGRTVVSFLLGTALISLTVLALIVWNEKVEVHWYGNQEFLERTWFEAWAALGNSVQSAQDVSALILGSVVIVVLPISLALSLMLLPIVHRSGRAVRSWGCSCAAAAGVVGPGCVAVALIGSAIVMLDNTRDRRRAMNLGWSDWEQYGEGFIVWSGFALSGLMMIWLIRAAVGARNTVRLPTVPPQCEGCGYDLTHLPEGGRCTECGLATAESLGVTARRSGVAWERSRTPGSWFAATVSDLFTPRVFYKHLQMRKEDQSARRFEFWTCLAIGAMSGPLILLMILVGDSNVDTDEIVGALAFGSVVPCVVAWVLHRAVGAITGTAEFIRKQASVFAHISKVWHYEIVYLWIIWVFNIAFTWSIIFLDEWMTELFSALSGASRYFFVEPICLLIGNGVLIIFWCLRYRRAVMLTRWGNV